MASVPGPARQTGRQLASDHEGFLRYRRMRWLKAALALCLIVILAYAMADAKPRPNGGSWLGYMLGTIGALLIVWLALLGVRKRTMQRGAWSLKAWTSAHVYLGSSLVVIATLHSGFQFGWNVHTLAWALMILVIASGIYGAVVYTMMPSALSSNRDQMTERQMIEALAAIDRQLEQAAQSLERRWTEPVEAALGEHAVDGGLWWRLTASRRTGPTQQVVDIFNRAVASEADDSALLRIEALLQRRLAELERMRRHARLKAQLEIWLYIHVPATFALIAALTAHIVSVFFYW
jgi:hypothetical protein